MEKELYFLFYGKILGLWCELDGANMYKLETSKITPARTLERFKERAKEQYSDKKIVWLKVGF